jgi:phosphoglycolate phosphatase
MPHSSKLQAIIFDLDGTLIDSLADLAESANRMLTRHGYPVHVPAAYRRFIGDGVHKLIEQALPKAQRSPELIAQHVAEYQANYQELWHDKTVPYPGIVDLLAKLRSAGLKVGVISNKPHHFTALCCDHFFAPGAFDHVLGQRDDVPRKPNPAGAKEMAQSFDLPVSACAYVGDSGIDMTFAKNSGLTAIGVRWGFRSESELLECGAQHLVSTSDDLLSLIHLLS